MMQLQKMLAILFLALSITNYCQSQIDVNTIEAVGNLSIYSVSLSDDSTTLAIGTYDALEKDSKSGHVRVYNNNSGVWSQIGNRINGEAVDDWSGYSVSLSNDGTIVAIGAKRNHGSNGAKSGHVRVYKYNSGIWKQVGSDIDGEALGDWSGYSVSLSGDGTTLAIGAILNSGNSTKSGHVRVYNNNFGVWTQVGADINGKNTKDYFGASVSLSSNGSILAIGAHQGGMPSGYVSVYKKNILGNWQQIGADIVGEPTSNFLGWDVSLSKDGSRVAIGAYMNNNEKGIRYAYVRVYQNRSNTWVQRGIDIDGKSTGYDLIFNNISWSNGTITLIGAYEKYSGKKKNVPKPGIDYMRVYKYKDSSNMWSQINAHI